MQGADFTESPEAPANAQGETGAACEDGVDGLRQLEAWVGEHKDLEAFVVVEGLDEVAHGTDARFHGAGVALVGLGGGGAASLEFCGDGFGAQQSGLEGEVDSRGENGVDEAGGVAGEEGPLLAVGFVGKAIVGLEAVAIYRRSFAKDVGEELGFGDFALEEGFVALAGFGSGSFLGDDSYRCDGVAKRDHPEPSVLEPDDDDVSVLFAGFAGDAFEMVEDGESPWVGDGFLRNAERAAHDAGAAAGVDNPAGADRLFFFRIQVLDGRFPSFAGAMAFLDEGALQGFAAAGACVVEKDLVEAGALDLVGLFAAFDESVAEDVVHGLGAIGQGELGPVLFDESG